MSKQHHLESEKRVKTGSAEARRMRRLGFIPAVVYGKNEPSTLVKIERRKMEGALHTSAGENIIIDLAVKGDEKSRTVIIKEVQIDPVQSVIQHVDFDHISLTQTIQVKVPVDVKGQAVGVTQHQGILERVMWELEVECLPTQIPDKISVECSALNIGEAIHIKDLQLPAGIKVLHESDAVVVTVVPPAKEELPETPAEGEAQGAEPEVIQKGKKEEEDAPSAEAGAKPKPATEDKK
jgi:large subunit ribosomal protein L25